MKKDNISFNKFNIFHHIRSGGRHETIKQNTPKICKNQGVAIIITMGTHSL